MLRAEIHDERKVRICPQALKGKKEVLGLWVEQTKGAKFWLKVINDLKTRDLNNILIAVPIGSRAFPRQFASVYRRPWCRLVLRVIRNSLVFVA